MHFKRLEIFGFKSFADKTVLNFEPGITAIVGPNGCGKSNIFDAIRWVLGEQSIKELRGSSMDDVIFNGTDKKLGLGFAEVSLVFSNESRMLPVDYNEVTVTRRLFRSGESEYLMNKTQVRLKDIAELFMGTGIGAEAYSLVQQGKVDLVVSARPEDRRVILDEASGITKFKAKRKEALSKLNSTEDNLLRINDIITEVKRQISSLERQANKARRYQAEFEKLKALEIRLARFDVDALNARQQQIGHLEEEFKNKEAECLKELEEMRQSLQADSQRLAQLEDRIGEVKSEDIKLDSQKDIHLRQIEFNEERLENLAVNDKRLQTTQLQLTEKIRGQQQQLTEVRRVLDTLSESVHKGLETLGERKSVLAEINKYVQEANRGIKEEEHKILGITSSQVQVKNRLTEIMKESQGCLARKRRLEMERTKVTQEKIDVEGRLTQMQHNLAGSVAKIETLHQEWNVQNSELTAWNDKVNVLTAIINDLEKKKLFLISQQEFIEKLRVQYEDIPDPVVEGRLYTQTQPLEHRTGIIGKVKQVRQVEAEGSGGVDTARMSLDPHKALYEIVCETKFIELDPQQIALRIDELTKDIEQRTAELQICQQSVNNQKRLVAKIEAQRQEEEKIRSVYEAQKKSITEEFQKLGDEMGLVLAEMDEVETTLQQLAVAEQESAQKLDQSNRLLQDTQMRIREMQERIASKAKEREATTVSIAQLEAEVAAVEDKKAGHEANAKTLTESLNGAANEIQRIEDELGGMSDKREQFNKDIEACRSKVREIEEKKSALKETLTAFTSQRDEASQALDLHQRQMAQKAGAVDEIRNQLHDIQMAQQETNFKEKEIKDRLWQSYKIEWDQIPSSLPTVSMESASLQISSDVEQAMDGSQQVEQGDLRSQEPKEQQEADDPQEWRQKILLLRKKCEGFGAVNLVAITEFDELRGRFEFLTKQQSDLITAKESLMATIRKINRQTREMFLETFTKVSEEFRIYFRMLFGGGDAQLVLLDPENVLESGIEIVARPPGKKLQNISLLSGGEKTLTAIGLIFGVFKVNPSPFCVLDEIDAALDESNVGRFSYLLKDFAKIAQFIVITHNKKTIASADVMYGITMQETGVSKIVSVKFNEANKTQDNAQENLKEDVVVAAVA
jgi:chromosome segregation protein